MTNDQSTAQQLATPFDPLDFCQEEDRGEREARFSGPPRKWFAVDCDRMYPAVIAAIAGGAKPTDRSQVVDGELVKDADAEKYRLDLARVRKLPEQAFDDALLEEVTVAGEENGKPFERTHPPTIKLDTSRRADRAEVLETARLWFTNELQRAVGGPIGVHLVATNRRWKL